VSSARGGMGQVLEVEKDGRIFALKILRSSDLELQMRFLREGQAQARVQHRLVARIHSSGESKLGSYILMERLAGPDLAAWIKSRGPCDWPEAQAIILSLCSALHAIHEAGLIHRDLKTSNIIFRSPGEPVICDFGLAHVSDAEALTASGVALGTPYSMAPEQIQGLAIDARVDIWALGVLAYELLTAQRPFQGASLQQLSLAICEGQYRPLSEHALSSKLPPQASSFINQCLQVAPDARFASALAAHDALRGEAYSSRRRAPRNLALAALASLIAAILGAIYYSQGMNDPRTQPPARLHSTAWASLETAAKDVLAEQLLAATLRALVKGNGQPADPPPRKIESFLSLPSIWDPIDLSLCPPNCPNLALLAFLRSPKIRFVDAETNRGELLQIWREMTDSPRPYGPELINRLSASIAEIQTQSAAATYDSVFTFLSTILLEDSGELYLAARRIIQLEQSLIHDPQVPPELSLALEDRRRLLWRAATIDALKSGNRFSDALELIRGQKIDPLGYDALNDALRQFFAVGSEIPINNQTRAMKEIFEASRRHRWLTIPPASADVMEPIIRELEKRNRESPEIFLFYGLSSNHFQAARKRAVLSAELFARAVHSHSTQAEARSLALLWIRSLAMNDILYFSSSNFIELSKAPACFEAARSWTANPKLLALYDVIQDLYWEEVTFDNYLEELTRRLSAFDILKSQNAPHWAACALRSVLNNLAQILLGVFYDKRPADWELQLNTVLGKPWKDWITEGIPRWQKLPTRRPDEIQFEIARILCGQTLQETLKAETPVSLESALAAMELAESLFSKTLNDKNFSTTDISDPAELSIMTCKFTHERVKLFEAMKLRDRSLAEFENWLEKIRKLSGIIEDFKEYTHCRDQWLSLVDTPREKEEILNRLKFSTQKK
jgi:hypothetical protein